MWPYVHRDKQVLFSGIKFHFGTYNQLTSQEKRWIIHRINKYGGKMGIQCPENVELDKNLGDFRTLVSFKVKNSEIQITVIIDDESPLSSQSQSIFSTQGREPKIKAKTVEKIEYKGTWQASKRSQNLLKRAFVPAKCQKICDGPIQAPKNCFKITTN